MIGMEGIPKSVEALSALLRRDDWGLRAMLWRGDWGERGMTDGVRGVVDGVGGLGGFTYGIGILALLHPEIQDSGIRTQLEWGIQ